MRCEFCGGVCVVGDCFQAVFMLTDFLSFHCCFFRLSRPEFVPVPLSALYFLSRSSDVNHRVNMIDDLNDASNIFSRPSSAAEPTRASGESMFCFFSPSSRNAEAESDVSGCPQLRGGSPPPQRAAQRPLPAASHLKVSGSAGSAVLPCAACLRIRDGGGWIWMNSLTRMFGSDVA